MTDPQLICTECGATAGPLDWQCATCGGPLDFAVHPAFQPNAIVADDWSVWRYRAMLPVEKRVSLGEGGTPLTETVVDGYSFYVKQEYLNPTGSFKDRGTVTMMNHLAAHEVREVVEDSSGNAGASVAAYSTALGFPARIFVPETGSPTKKALISSVGGQLVEVPGPQYAKTAACLEAAKTTTYATHAWSPYFILGQMTVAWEVWEQLGRRAPDVIAVPVGQGGLFLGFYRGFQRLYEAGLIERVPRMIAIQSEGCDPIVRGWERGAEVAPPVTPTPTIADGIIVDHPVRSKEILRAIRNSGGSALRVGNETIAKAREAFTRHGLIVEPTSAVPLAAMAQIVEQVGRDVTIVMPLTGNGLKLLGT